MEHIRRFRPSTGGLVALVAVLLVSAGGATAAGLITSGDIKNGTIRSKDLHRSVRAKLVHRFAKVDAAGTLLAGRKATSASRTSAGDFRVTFDRSVEGCAVVGSPRGTSDNEFYGFLTTYAPGGNVVRVVVRDAKGKKDDGAGFNLVVTC